MTLLRTLCLTVLLLLAAAGRGAAGERSLSVPIETEHGLLAKLQTAYLYNIARFVTWRGEASEVWLCLPAESPLLRYAIELDGHDLGDGRQFRVGPLAGTARCDLAFVHAALRQGAAESARLTQNPDLLTVSDRPDALERGYALQFFLEEDSVRFAAGGDVLAHATYKVSSKLLRLARPRPVEHAR